MYLAGIQRDSIVDGPGIRDVIFFQGCPHHCEGCHNPETWKEGTNEHFVPTRAVFEELKDSPNDITFSGGEPLEQLWAVLYLGDMFKHQGKKVWCYTGYTYEDLDPFTKTLLGIAVDVLVDGKFMKELADKNLLFRGSSNQRFIDTYESSVQEKTVEWRLEDEV